MATVAGAQQGGPQPKRSSSPPRSSAQGAEIFRSHCSACHGLDARGGEHGPDLVNNPAVHALSDRQLFETITGGIPRKGMPAFNALLQPDEIRTVVAYLRRAGGAGPSAPVTGDRKLGEALFFGKTGCSSCHMISGRGGFLGSDLSGYGRDHSADEIRAAILHPNDPNNSKGFSPGPETATVTTRSGERWTGIIRDEDNFSIQLLDAQGKFHLLMKSDLAGLERGIKSPMPDDYGSRLSAAEVDALVAYLASAQGGEPAPERESHRKRKNAPRSD